MQLKWVVRLGRRDVGLVELDRRACESTLGVSALAVQALARPKSRNHLVRIVIRFEVGLDVRLLLRVRRANRIGGSLGGLESVCHSERDVLAVIANHIVLERRAPLFANSFESLSQRRAKD